MKLLSLFEIPTGRTVEAELPATGIHSQRIDELEKVHLTKIAKDMRSYTSDYFHTFRVDYFERESKFFDGMNYDNLILSYKVLASIIAWEIRRKPTSLWVRSKNVEKDWKLGKYNDTELL